MNPVMITMIAIPIVILFLIWWMILPLISLWLQAFLSGVKIPFTTLLAMKFRKVNPTVIVINKIRLAKSGVLSIDTPDLEIHALSGGNVSNVVSAYIAMMNDGKQLDWKALTTYDLTGRDPLKLVNDAIQSEDYTDVQKFLDPQDLSDDLIPHTV